MKVAIDARMLKMSGIGVYIQHLIENKCYEILIGNKEELEKYNKQNTNIIKFNSPIYGIKEQLKFPYKKLRKMKPDILHVPHYNVPIFYRGKIIVTIHDLTHLILPQFLPNRFSYIYAKIMLWIATKKASHILTVSENTKKDIIKMFKVNPDKITVTYNGVGEEFVKKDKSKILYLYDKFNIPHSKKCIMYVGNLKPHKNLERLLEAYSKIKNRQDTCLILVGKAFSNYDELDRKEKILKIENQVIHTGIVSQEELIDLYNLADIFIFPSLYEGFGIPIIEALSCGTTVICSNNSSLPEVGGKLVKYFDPYNIEEMVQKIDEELENNNIINLEHQDIKQWLEKFNWKKTSKETKEIFNRIYNENINSK